MCLRTACLTKALCQNQLEYGVMIQDRIQNRIVFMFESEFALNI